MNLNATLQRLGFLLLLAPAGCGALVTVDDENDRTLAARGGGTGNGAPSGSHYNLNIIGKTTHGSGDDGSNGHVIFVPLSGSTRILLTEGEFQVIDSNGLDGPASFQLPNPDPSNSGTTTYSVFARALGTPGGSSQTTTCATAPDTGEVVCSIATLTLTRSRGGSTFENVSRELLYVYADLDGDGTVERVPLFDDRLEDYFWQYDNNRLRLAQLRFYPIATQVP